MSCAAAGARAALRLSSAVGAVGFGALAVALDRALRRPAAVLRIGRPPAAPPDGDDDGATSAPARCARRRAPRSAVRPAHGLYLPGRAPVRRDRAVLVRWRRETALPRKNAEPPAPLPPPVQSRRFIGAKFLTRGGATSLARADLLMLLPEGTIARLAVLGAAVDARGWSPGRRARAAALPFLLGARSLAWRRACAPAAAAAMVVLASRTRSRTMYRASITLVAPRALVNLSGGSPARRSTRRRPRGPRSRSRAAAATTWRSSAPPRRGLRVDGRGRPRRRARAPGRDPPRRARRGARAWPATTTTAGVNLPVDPQLQRQRPRGGLHAVVEVAAGARSPQSAQRVRVGPTCVCDPPRV